MKLADIAVMLYNHWLDDYCSLILKNQLLTTYLSCILMYSDYLIKSIGNYVMSISYG